MVALPVTAMRLPCALSANDDPPATTVPSALALTLARRIAGPAAVLALVSAIRPPLPPLADSVVSPSVIDPPAPFALATASDTAPPHRRHYHRRARVVVPALSRAPFAATRIVPPVPAGPRRHCPSRQDPAR